MFITIDSVIGEKTIFLSYPIQNFDSSKEVAVMIQCLVIMLNMK